MSDLSAEQQELWTRVMQLWALASSRDSKQIAGTLHPDYVGWDMTAAAPHDRMAAVHSVSGDSPALAGYQLHPLSVKVYAGHTGVVHYAYAATVLPQHAEPRRVTGKWTEVYVKREAGWLLAAVSGRPEANEVHRPDSGTRFIDVSHTIEHGMITYKGLPAPVICDYLSREASRARYAPGTEFQIGKIEMVANTGTYLDSPFHRYADGKDLAALPLTSLADLECLVFRVPPGGGPAIDRLPVTPDQVRGKAVLVATGWDRHWRTEQYFENHPYLTGDLAEWLARAAAALVGIDSHNIDSTETGERPVHSILLGREIPIVEHLRGLGAVPDRGGRFYAVPAKVRQFGTFPVRAFVQVAAALRGELG